MHFDYDRLVQASLKGVIREVLTYVADHGLPGDHHFYITFDTSFDGLAIPGYLRERYPDDMTIVLQKGFWGLAVSEDEIEVNLTFNQKPELLVIPFAAIIAFVDPSAEFALQFQTDLDSAANEEGTNGEGDEDEGEEENDFEPADEGFIVAPRKAKDQKTKGQKIKGKASGPVKGKTAKKTKTAKKATKPGETGNVVALDTFRKKG